MYVAYVLLLCDTKDRNDDFIIKELSSLPSVIEVSKVDGPYDFVVKLSHKDTNTLKKIIGKQMGTIKGILSTITLIAYID